MGFQPLTRDVAPRIRPPCRRRRSRETGLASLAPELAYRAIERRSIGHGKIKLVPPRDVAPGSVQTQHEPNAKPQAFEESSPSNDVLRNDPRGSSTLSAEFVKAAKPAMIRRVDLPTDQAIQANGGDHWLPGSLTIHLRNKCSTAATVVSPTVSRSWIF
jgi:hypothetical protein